ncbi:MAG TPA: ECF-type sigma factor, partial [Rhizomicrobium sp.]|nr:ECF-type sigma factor [Rhizomicrobium sp.]
LEKVTGLVYRDLRRLAAHYLQDESNANTLQPTALVHEAYLRVASIRELDWKGRGQFIAVVAQMMRRILVDHARARRAAKRNWIQNQAVPLPESPRSSPIDILAVDSALDRLAARYARCAQVVELRFFGGLEFPEIANSLEISLATVERDWRFARAWLQDKIQGGMGGATPSRPAS